MAQNTVEVRWHATLDEELDIPFWDEWSHWLPPWAAMASHAEEVVNTIASDVVDEEVWADTFGHDETSAFIWVTVHAPAAIAGTYEVHLQRVVKVNAHKVKPKVKP